jgi:hypothetical protein
MMQRLAAMLCLASGAALLSSPAEAHIASSGFVVANVQGQEVTGSVELAVRDVELAIGVDADHDGKVTWGELRAGEPALGAYLQQHLTLSAPASCAVRYGAIQVNDRVDGAYAWLPFTAHCPEAVRQLAIHYQVMDGIDPSHRGLLTLTAGSLVQTGVLGGRSVQSAFSVYAPSKGRAFVEIRTRKHWEPVPKARPALISILKVVTAFTLAHSLTLSLAALDVVRLPSRLTESVIAASIIIAALNNIFPVVTDGRARIAFAFGLLHGFGFASVLADMGLPHGARLISLVAFNLGIETGQLAVVLAVMPVVYALRSGQFYRRAVMPWGSAAIALIALFWFVQRAVFATGM